MKGFSKGQVGAWVKAFEYRGVPGATDAVFNEYRYVARYDPELIWAADTQSTREIPPLEHEISAAASVLALGLCGIGGGRMWVGGEIATAPSNRTGPAIPFPSLIGDSTSADWLG